MANKKPTPIVEEATEEIIMPVEEPVVEEIPNHLIVTAELLNVRSEASKDSKILSIIPKNEKVILNTKKLMNGFYSITTQSGISGYVMKDFVVKE